MTQHHPQLGRAMTEAEYAREWQKNAGHFETDGHYQWLNERLGDTKRVLEIGCGAGASTLQMAKSGRQVAAIEVNANLIRMSQQLLENNGIAVQVVGGNDAGRMTSWPENVQVIIVHADFLTPEGEAAAAAAKIDAIACWMVGANPGQIGMALKKGYMQFDGSEAAEYRKRLHIRCFEVGRRILPGSGFVQVADRVAVDPKSPPEAVTEVASSVYQDLAGRGYRIDRDATQLRPLGQFQTSAIQYVMSKVSGPDTSLITPALVSIRAWQWAPK